MARCWPRLQLVALVGFSDLPILFLSWRVAGLRCAAAAVGGPRLQLIVPSEVRPRNGHQAKSPAMPITKRCPPHYAKTGVVVCFSNMCSSHEVRHAALINTKWSRRLPGTATLRSTKKGCSFKPQSLFRKQKNITQSKVHACKQSLNFSLYSRKAIYTKESIIVTV